MSNKMSIKEFRKKFKKESSHQSQGIELLELCGCIVWRQNVGVGRYVSEKTGKIRYVSYGVKGLPDVMGYKPLLGDKPYSTPVYWEVKRSGARVRQEQRNFIETAKENGCFAIIGTFEDLQNELERWNWIG
jgi:hypothetical protein